MIDLKQAVEAYVCRPQAFGKSGCIRITVPIARDPEFQHQISAFHGALARVSRSPIVFEIEGVELTAGDSPAVRTIKAVIWYASSHRRSYMVAHLRQLAAEATAHIATNAVHDVLIRSDHLVRPSKRRAAVRQRNKDRNERDSALKREKRGAAAKAASLFIYQSLRLCG